MPCAPILIFVAAAELGRLISPACPFSDTPFCDAMPPRGALDLPQQIPPMLLKPNRSPKGAARTAHSTRYAGLTPSLGHHCFTSHPAQSGLLAKQRRRPCQISR